MSIRKHPSRTRCFVQNHTAHCPRPDDCEKVALGVLKALRSYCRRLASANAIRIASDPESRGALVVAAKSADGGEESAAEYCETPKANVASKTKVMRMTLRSNAELSGPTAEPTERGWRTLFPAP